MKRITFFALAVLLALAACAGSDDAPALTHCFSIGFAGNSFVLDSGIAGFDTAPFCTLQTNPPVHFLRCYAAQATITSNEYSSNYAPPPFVIPPTPFIQLQFATNHAPFGIGTYDLRFVTFRAAVGTNYMYIEDFDTRPSAVTITEYGPVGGYVRGTFHLTNFTLSVISNTNTGMATDIPGTTIDGTFSFRRIADNSFPYGW